ncbi:hypothetical protein BN439_3303 [Erwinia amylovora Ea644]|nr:hypothetical protein BN439_3303 [Erwinia amylovora Ea644]
MERFVIRLFLTIRNLIPLNAQSAKLIYLLIKQGFCWNASHQIGLDRLFTVSGQFDFKREGFHSD